jgi:hypothetical protein
MKRFGFSSEEAFAMSPGVRMAAFIVHGEDEGNEFDYKHFQWIRK